MSESGATTPHSPVPGVFSQRTDHGGPSPISDQIHPLDPAALLERCMGDASIADVLLTKLETQLLRDLRILESAVPQGDVGATARVSHALKGAAGTVAAEPIRALASSIESLAKRGLLDDASAELDRLRDEIDRCIAFLPQARRLVGCESPATPESAEDAS